MRDGPVRAEFPYFLTLLRIAFRPSVRDWLKDRPSWIRFYVPGDPSTGFEVMEGILAKFAASCAQRGKLCLVVLFPTPKSLEYFLETRRSALERLTQMLEQRGIVTLDLTADFAHALKDRFCAVVYPPNCAGHFNARKAGSDLVHKI
jgi:hypothetical protein